MKDCSGYIAVVVGSGPSLSDAQIEIVRKAHVHNRVCVIVTNNTIERMPWADVAFFGDYLAVEHYKPQIGNCGLEWWTSSKHAAQRFGVHFVPAEVGDGLGDRALRMNGHTGGLAVNLATLWGARRILLLGFDMKLAADGRPHWFGNHPDGLIQTQRFADWIKSMGVIARDAVARDISIINCTPGSALQCFDQLPLEDALP